MANDNVLDMASVDNLLLRAKKEGFQAVLIAGIRPNNKIVLMTNLADDLDVKEVVSHLQKHLDNPNQ